MPVIIAPEQYARWLDPRLPEVPDLVAPYPAQATDWYAVSTQVNSVQHDNASLIERVAPPPADEPVMDEPARPRPPDQEELF
jgi:putative SOS response-associated peptidase YedK